MLFNLKYFLKMENISKLVPYKKVKLDKKEQVKEMFNKIAKSYDLLNHIFSLGIDKRWRRKLIKNISKFKHDEVLDLATGTGDLIFYLAKLKAKKIIGIDISEEMLTIGKKKISKKLKNYKGQIELRIGDSEQMCFEDESFDIVSCAFGIRNSENLYKWLKEVNRVLRKQGIFAILEFSHIKNKMIFHAFNFYFNKILPFVGKIITGDKAYYYLPESVKNFPSGKKFTKLVENFGFKTLKVKSLSFGIASIYIFKKIK